MNADTTSTVGGTNPAGPDRPGGTQLAAADIKVHFAGVKALDGVSLELASGEILGLIGPNGAGKTTLINVLSGFQRPTKGAISLRGIDVSRWPPHRFPREGLVRTFQRAHPFAELTVLENAVVAAFGVGVGKRKAHEIAWTALENVGLVDRASVPASILTAGQERRLGLARALATTPTFLLLDEPAAGLNEGEGDELVASIRRARADFGCGVLLVEHDMRVVMRVCDRVQVLNFGQTLKVGTPDEIRTDPGVLSAYLGPAVST